LQVALLFQPSVYLTKIVPTDFSTQPSWKSGPAEESMQFVEESVHSVQSDEKDTPEIKATQGNKSAVLPHSISNSALSNSPMEQKNLRISTTSTTQPTSVSTLTLKETESTKQKHNLQPTKQPIITAATTPAATINEREPPSILISNNTHSNHLHPSAVENPQPSLSSSQHAPPHFQPQPQAPQQQVPATTWPGYPYYPMTATTSPLPPPPPPHPTAGSYYPPPGANFPYYAPPYHVPLPYHQPAPYFSPFPYSSPYFDPYYQAQIPQPAPLPTSIPNAPNLKGSLPLRSQFPQKAESRINDPAVIELMLELQRVQVKMYCSIKYYS
jgi:hypothetical protein